MYYPNEADIVYQRNLEKAMRGLTKAQNNLQNLQYGVGNLGEGEYYDPQTGVIVKQMTQRITPRVCETMIAQFLSGYKIPIAQIPSFIAASRLKFKRVSDITFSMVVGGRSYNVRHICDAGVSFGSYIDVPLITRDLINMNNRTVVYEYRYDATYAKLQMYICELCGTVLYTYNE